MTSLSAEYRSRLYATQKSRRSRNSEERRNSGPVDVDDFYVPASPSSQSRRRSKTPQPPTKSGMEQQQGYTGEDRRSQSAPRSISDQLSNAGTGTRQWAHNGETVFCFQPGRRRFKGSNRPMTVSHSNNNEKKSLSQFQHINEIHQQDDQEVQPVQKNSAKGPLHHSAMSSYADDFENERIDLRIHNKIDVTKTFHAKNQATSKAITDDPRAYAASYYAKKAGVNRRETTVHSKPNVPTSVTAPDKAKTKHTHQTVTRSVSQKMADCLLLSKSIYADDDGTRRRSSKTNPLTSLCFVDNLVDMSHDTIDITTIDVHSFDGRSPNVSALHENSPFRKETPNKNSDNHLTDTHTGPTSAKKKWYEDSSTNQTTTVTNSSSSENEEDYEDVITPVDPEPRPPKVLNVRKKTIDNDVPRQLQRPPQAPHSTPLIQVNPDDYEFSYRKKSNFPVPNHDDHDFLSEIAVNSTFTDAPVTLIGPQQQRRDLQRRPRGVFEHVTSNDEDDLNNTADDVITAFSTPYDESAAKAQQIARGSMAEAEKQLKYNQAVLEIQRQRASLSTVEHQLKSTVLELQATKSELHKTIDNSAERSRTYADATARIVKERLDSDERLQTEQDANKLLKEEVECLKREVISLSLELERAVHRNNWEGFQIPLESSIHRAVENSLADDLSTTSNKSDSHTVKVTDVRPPASPTISNALVEEATKAVEFMSEKLQVSQKEVTDLQSKLTATQAASELYKMTSEQIKRERDDAVEQKAYFQREMLQAMTKIRETDMQTNLYEREMNETARLKEEIVALTNDLTYSNIRASDYVTNVQRLEEDLLRAQLNVAKYETQASSLVQELNESKKKASSLTQDPQLDVQPTLVNPDCTPTIVKQLVLPTNEQSMERQLIEEELSQMFALHNRPPNEISQRSNDKINLTNRGSSNKTNRESFDLLDILRKKLDLSSA